MWHYFSRLAVVMGHDALGTCVRVQYTTLLTPWIKTVRGVIRAQAWPAMRFQNATTGSRLKVGINEREKA